MEYAIIFLPLIGSIFGYLGRSINKLFSEIFTSLLVSVSAIFSIIVFWNGIQINNYNNYKIFEWISSGDFVANWSINLDPLSSVMLVVVTFVSSLVHIYSIGYMSHDPHKPRFMSYLSLFTFSMLVLVASDNFLQLFFGWEGVGLCSYLLIGFWYKKETANNAACSGSFVPLLTLGIPGSGTTAVMLGALLGFGIQPGPRLYQTNPEIFWSVIMSMYIGMVILLILNLPLIPYIARVLATPRTFLIPLILFFSVTGIYLMSFKENQALCS